MKLYNVFVLNNKPMVWAPFKTSPWETLGQTQHLLRRLYFTIGLGRLVVEFFLTVLSDLVYILYIFGIIESLHVNEVVRMTANVVMSLDSWQQEEVYTLLDSFKFNQKIIYSQLLLC